MIGQHTLKTYLSMQVNNPPMFLLIVGTKGSGKRTLVDWFTRDMKAHIEIVTDQKVDSIRSVVEQGYTLNEKKFFVFPDAQEMNIQAQNAFLKFLEEPPLNAYIIMTVTSLGGVLSTIRSRATVLTMSGYSREELRHFTDDETLLNICQTPGQIERYSSMDWTSLLDHCTKVIESIGRINMANVFNILKKVDAQNYDLVIPMMQYVIGSSYPEGPIRGKQLKVLRETAVLLDYSRTVNIQNALEVMLLKMWEVS